MRILYKNQAVIEGFGESDFHRIVSAMEKYNRNALEFGGGKKFSLGYTTDYEDHPFRMNTSVRCHVGYLSDRGDGDWGFQINYVGTEGGQFEIESRARQVFTNAFSGKSRVGEERDVKFKIYSILLEPWVVEERAGEMSKDLKQRRDVHGHVPRRAAPMIKRAVAGLSKTKAGGR